MGGVKSNSHQVCTECEVLHTQLLLLLWGYCVRGLPLTGSATLGEAAPCSWELN